MKVKAAARANGYGAGDVMGSFLIKERKLTKHATHSQETVFLSPHSQRLSWHPRWCLTRS
jgi:hypothetical protein